MCRNPLTARVAAMQSQSGLWSASCDCDAGLLNESTRVRWTFGHLSQSDAVRSASAIATAIGRVPIAA